MVGTSAGLPIVNRVGNVIFNVSIDICEYTAAIVEGSLSRIKNCTQV
jgi:hypothetical protein